MKDESAIHLNQNESLSRESFRVLNAKTPGKSNKLISSNRLSNKDSQHYMSGKKTTWGFQRNMSQRTVDNFGKTIQKLNTIAKNAL